MEDVLDDVPDGAHKCFMRQYLKDWPYPHLNKYRAGQSFNVELNGVMQMCEVVVIDCSLMQVVFQVSVSSFAYCFLHVFKQFCMRDFICEGFIFQSFLGICKEKTFNLTSPTLHLNFYIWNKC